MPNYKNAFPSKYLKADDISTPRAVEIKSVDFEDVGAAQRQERKLVVHFVELAKPLVLNLDQRGHDCGDQRHERLRAVAGNHH